MSWVDKAKYLVAEELKRSPLLWSLIFDNIHRMRFLLPHERQYHGLKRLHLEPEKLILDIGANNGLSALGFRAIGLRNRILSVEADRFHEASLKRVKTQIRDFDYLLLAAGETRKTITLFRPTYNGIPIHSMTSGSLPYAKETA